jgi:L-threonylcarbamoyladenylate synthase
MLSDVVNSLKQGDVIAVPTEAVYGLSADPYNLAAVKKILEMKTRNPDKGLILVGSSFDQLEPFIEPLSSEVYARLMATWPGPYTWVVPARASVSPVLRGVHTTLAIRITAHPEFAALCTAFGGPLVSTSANPEGLRPAMSQDEVHAYFGQELFILPGTLGGLDKPTEIKDGLSGTLIR